MEVAVTEFLQVDGGRIAYDVAGEGSRADPQSPANLVA